MNTTEIWKSIPGFEGRYEVSSFGRVRSLTRIIRVNGDANRDFFFRVIPGRILKPGEVGIAGHFGVQLGAKNCRSVHSLVLLAFVGPRPRGKEGRHLDGNPGNNNLSNLCYGTRGRNMLDKKYHQRRSRNSKLHVKDIQAIKRALRSPIWEKQRLIAARFGISQSMVSLISREKVHVDI